MYGLNDYLCEQINHIHMHIFHYGRALVDNRWGGNMQNPVYSRLIYVYNGDAVVVTHSGKTYLREKKWYLIPAGCSFEYYCNGMFDHLYFHFKISSTDGIDLFNSCGKILSLESNRDKADFFNKGLEKKTIIDGLGIRANVYELITEFIKENNITIEIKNYSNCVSKAITYIRQNLSQKLSVEEIANNAYVSKSTLTKHFRNELSMSIGEYISNMVLFEASILLLKSNMSILEISEKFKFCDQFYFSRVFAAKFEVSPSAYRKRFKF